MVKETKAPELNSQTALQEKMRVRHRVPGLGWPPVRGLREPYDGGPEPLRLA